MATAKYSYFQNTFLFIVYSPKKLRGCGNGNILNECTSVAFFSLYTTLMGNNVNKLFQNRAIDKTEYL